MKFSSCRSIWGSSLSNSIKRIGVLRFCLDSLVLDRSGQITTISRNIALREVMRELGHVLGMYPDLFKFFRNPKTGQPLTPRPFVESMTPCVVANSNNGGQQSQMIEKPACNTIKEGMTNRGVRYYEVVTPTVVAVARNQFGCQLMTGARLENQVDGSENCFGFDWEMVS